MVHGRFLILLCCVLVPRASFSQDMPDTNSSWRHFHVADSLKTRGQYDSASIHYVRAIALFETMRGWSGYVQALTAECANQTEWGNAERAVESGVKAVEVGTRELGEKTREVATAHYVTAYACTQAGDLPQALPHFEASLRIMHLLLPDDDLTYAEVYEGFSEYYSELGDFDRQINLLQKALTIRRKQGGDDSPALAVTYSNLGLAFQDKGRYHKAAEYLAKAVDHQVATVGENHPQTAMMYNNLGMSYFFGGDNDRAVDNYKRSLAIYASLGGDNPRAAFAHNNIAMAYRLQDDFGAALEHGTKARDLFAASLGSDHPNVAAIVNNMGRTSFDMGNYDQAEDAFRFALGLWRGTLGSTHPNVAQSYYNLSDVAAKRRQFTLAHALLDSSLEIRRTSLGETHPRVAETLRARGNLYRDQGKDNDALRSYQQALMVLVEGFADTNVRANPDLDQLNPRMLLLGTLTAKADALQKRSASLADLKASAETYVLAANLIDRLRQGFSTEGAKLYLTSESFDVLEKGIGASLQLFNLSGDSSYLGLAFGFAERGKAGMLSEALAEADARRFAGIPDSLLEREQSLRDDIAFLDTQVQRQKEAARRDSLKLSQDEIRLFDANRTYEALIGQFEQQYPSYYRLKVNSSRSSVQEIRDSLLREGEALLEYVVGDSTCHAFVITKSDIVVIPQRHNGSLANHVLAFRNALGTLDFEGYVRSAYSLYRILIAPVRKHLSGVKNLVIVPDGILHYLPFDALLTKSIQGSSPDFTRLPYLISDFEISYSPSASLSVEGRKAREPDDSGSFLGLAPVFADREMKGTLFETSPKIGGTQNVATTREIRLDGKAHPALPESEREVREIVRLFEDSKRPAKGYLHRSAAESVLRDHEIGSYRFIHLATHALIDENTPKLSGILFAGGDTINDEVLYTGEVYNLNLNADLVVLSACESGLGKVVRGEGILGLTRGLLYAGSNNIVVSLWQVADKSTADLMVEFYRGILGGEAYSSALRRAKLSMIKAGKYAYPLEWAPFVLVGR